MTNEEADVVINEFETLSELGAWLDEHWLAINESVPHPKQQSAKGLFEQHDGSKLYPSTVWYFVGTHKHSDNPQELVMETRKVTVLKDGILTDG